MDSNQEFYINNWYDPPKKISREDNSILVISYNVTNWMNYSLKSDIHENYASIKKMLFNYNFDLIILNDVLVDNDKLTLDKIINDFKKEKYEHHARCTNNGNHMIIFTKHKLKIAKYMSIKINNRDRMCLYIKIKGFKFVTTNLDDGESYQQLDENDIKRKEIEYNNQLKRKWQLQRIFNEFNNIDTIIGNFNFTINSPEFNMVTNDHKFIWDNIHEKTNPYGRTEFMFLNSKSKYKIINSYIIKCNYSNSLPIVTEFSKN